MGGELKTTLRSSRRQFDAEALIRTMVFNRLSDPCSKLGLLDWLERVEMPGVTKVTHQQLLRGMDALMDRVDEVKSGLTRLIKPLLDTSLSLVFYDLTTIRIHGEKELPDDLRQYGLNKETGGIARQFVLGVLQSADGIPLLHTVVPGNISEATTLRPMLERRSRCRAPIPKYPPRLVRNPARVQSRCFCVPIQKSPPARDSAPRLWPQSAA